MTTSTTDATEQRAGYPAEVIANEFIRLASEERHSLAQMQLHKRVYIAHGYSLALLGRPSPSTPCMPDATARSRAACGSSGQKGREPIREPLPAPADEPGLQHDPEALEVIGSVWHLYGRMDRLDLSRLTPRIGSPWWRTYGAPTRLIPDQITHEDHATPARSA